MTKEQIGYVKKRLSEGHSPQVIEKALLNTGYSNEQIKSLFEACGVNTSKINCASLNLTAGTIVTLYFKGIIIFLLSSIFVFIVTLFSEFIITSSFLNSLLNSLTMTLVTAVIMFTYVKAMYNKEGIYQSIKWVLKQKIFLLPIVLLLTTIYYFGSLYFVASFLILSPFTPTLISFVDIFVIILGAIFFSLINIILSLLMNFYVRLRDSGSNSDVLNIFINSLRKNFIKITIYTIPIMIVFGVFMLSILGLLSYVFGEYETLLSTAQAQESVGLGLINLIMLGSAIVIPLVTFMIYISILTVIFIPMLLLISAVIGFHLSNNS